ncbi:MAG: DUF885 family protein [Bdellovibrionales bacterium]
MRTVRFVLVVFLFIATFAHATTKTTPTAPATAEETTKTTAALNKLVDNYTLAVKKLDPFWSPYLDYEEGYDQFGDYPSAEYKQRAFELNKMTLAEVRQINPAHLPEKDLRTYKLFRGSLEMEESGFQFPWFYLDFNQMGNRMRSYLDDSSPAVGSFPFTKLKYFDAWVKRSEGFLPYVDRHIGFMREGVKNKYVLNCVIAKKALNTIQDGLEPVVEKHPFYRPLAQLPKDIKSKDRERITADFKMMIQNRIQPGFRKFNDFFTVEYMPHCRKTYGIGALPRGKEIYRRAIYASTGLKLSADEIHKIGLKEVARIRGEIDVIKKNLGFKGTLSQFFASRRANPSLFYSNKEEQLRAYGELKSKIDTLLPKYFNKIPVSDYKIVEGENPEDAAARYYPVTDSIPYGRFVVNTLNLKSIGKGSATTLSMHEANPGHHLQGALQYEMKAELSEYQRRIFDSNAFVEGWALYAEYLGREMGLFGDQEQMLGHLSEELWRAVRLVVDTGIHAKNWSREKTIKYMSENMAADLSAIETEADRYSVWPGQALGYKIGQLKILELRRKAEKTLGSKFNIRDFHTAVIGHGTVSLPVLEEQVNSWIKRVAESKTL